MFTIQEEEKQEETKKARVNGPWPRIILRGPINPFSRHVRIPGQDNRDRP